LEELSIQIFAITSVMKAELRKGSYKRIVIYHEMRGGGCRIEPSGEDQTLMSIAAGGKIKQAIVSDTRLPDS